ncbi:MAG TPA: ABC transporter permease [Solirubrobacteraceae bacterium]|nr:ABC transporter permease [Solirubrobacteraceae bacterium]
MAEQAFGGRAAGPPGRAPGPSGGAARPPLPSPGELLRRRHLLAQNVPLVVAVALLVAILVIYVVLYLVSIGSFPGAFEAASITDHAVPLSLAAVGQTVVVLTRGIDLSVGGMMDMTNALAALHLHGGLGPEILWTAIIMAIGAAGGALNGLLVAYGRVQPILVTLGTLSIFQGMALWILPSPGGHISSAYTGFFLNPGVPSALIYVVILGLGWSAFRRSRLGVDIYAVGNDEAAARANSVPVLRAKVLAYVLGGTLTAAAGIALATTTTGGDATGGDVFTLSSIAAAVVGGVSLFGGRGSAVGAMCGAFVLTVLVDVLFFANIDPLFQPFYQGLFLVLAVGASTLLGRYLIRRRR